MRITNHPILDDLIDRKKVLIYFDGKKIEAFEGETIAAALFAADVKVFRTTPVFHETRGVYCNRGRCTDCIMNVDGRPNVRTCVTIVKEGMVIKSIYGLGEWGKADE
jgi:predicted molibdopterin-dependent oxidoreductase YjgC